MRLIDADLVMDKVNECFDTCDQLDLHFTAQDVVDIIKSAPTVEPKPITHGHWIKGGYTFVGVHKVDEYICSMCNYHTLEAGNYCGNCSAKMDEAIENE